MVPQPGLVVGGGQGGTQGTFWGYGNVLYIACSDSYIYVYICKVTNLKCVHKNKG